MLSRQVIQEAFDTLSKGVMIVKEGSELWMQLVSQVAILGWVLDLEKYVPHQEAILREVRKQTSGRVSVSPGGS